MYYTINIQDKIQLVLEFMSIREYNKDHITGRQHRVLSVLYSEAWTYICTHVRHGIARRLTRGKPTVPANYGPFTSQNIKARCKCKQLLVSCELGMSKDDYSNQGSREYNNKQHYNVKALVRYAPRGHTYTHTNRILFFSLSGVGASAWTSLCQ